jgi:hypothetical protein
MVKSFLKFLLLSAGFSLVLGACANTPANPSSSTVVATQSGNSGPVSSQPAPLRQILSEAVAATTKSTAHFDTRITIMDKQPAMTVSSSYDWRSASGDSTVKLPGGAIPTAWTAFDGDKAYVNGGANSGPTWGVLQRPTAFAHYLGRTPLNDPSLLIKWLDGAEIVSGDTRSMVLHIPIPAAIQYMEPSMRAKTAEALESIGSRGMDAIVTFDDASHITSMTFNIRGADQVLYASNASKLSDFGKPMAKSTPGSPVPMSKFGGILLG